MNFQHLTKLIFIVSYISIFAYPSKNFNDNSTVLARENSLNVANPDNSFPLNSQEKQELDRGKVILKGQKGNYLGRVVATGDINTAWSVLVDYNNFDKFMPNIISSKVISQQGNKVVFEQVNVVDLWLFQQEFKVQIEAAKTKPDKINFEIVDGDLKKLIGRWEIETISPGKTLVTHAVEVEPGSDTEKAFFYGVYESSLEETLAAIALEINKRDRR